MRGEKIALSLLTFNLELLTYFRKTVNFKIIITTAMININREILFMPCIYFIHCVFGLFGSLFLIYRYSATWRKTPIKQSYNFCLVSFSFNSFSSVRSRRRGVTETKPFSTAHLSVPSSAGSSGITVDQNIFLPIGSVAGITLPS